MILRFSLNEILEDKGLIHVPPEQKGSLAEVSLNYHLFKK